MLAPARTFNIWPIRRSSSRTRTDSLLTMKRPSRDPSSVLGFDKAVAAGSSCEAGARTGVGWGIQF